MGKFCSDILISVLIVSIHYFNTTISVYRYMHMPYVVWFEKEKHLHNSKYLKKTKLFLCIATNYQKKIYTVRRGTIPCFCTYFINQLHMTLYRPSWSADQILGAPNTYPYYGDSSTAWAPRDTGSPAEFIEVFYSYCNKLALSWWIDQFETEFHATFAAKALHY